ncbi:MAG: ribbon-helix-helix domain-containing protein [Desulfobacteraceae bacterium]|nr:ribbon-helix-helix domain-containing protein [Desulfobacteraceae bacterium]
MGKDGKNAVRVTTTLTKDQNASLERLAKKNGVKKAWLVRRAVEMAIEEANGGPLLPLNIE